jgi:hypothetical protein
LQGALEIYRTAGNRHGEMTATNNLAGNFGRRGESARARELFLSANAMAREVRDRFMVVTTSMNLALLDDLAGQVAAARRGLEEAGAAARENGDRRAESFALLNLCRVLRRAGDAASAASACEQTEAIWKKTAERAYRADLFVERSALATAAGKFAEAEAAAQQAIGSAREQRSAPREVAGELALAEALWTFGRTAEAANAVDRARAAAAKVHDARTDLRIALAAGELALSSRRSRDWAAQAQALAEIADRAWAAGFIGDARDARLLHGRALQKARDRRAHAVLVSVREEARAAGDLLVARKAEKLLSFAPRPAWRP